MNEDDKDRLALILTGPMMLSALVGGIGVWIKAKGVQATAWLVDHHILVPRKQAVVKILDAGLDLPRIAAGAAILILVLVLTVSLARRKD